MYKILLEILLEPTWETFLALLIALDNLQEVFRCSLVTYFMSTLVEFSNAFG